MPFIYLNFTANVYERVEINTLKLYRNCEFMASHIFSFRVVILYLLCFSEAYVKATSASYTPHVGHCSLVSILSIVLRNQKLAPPMRAVRVSATTIGISKTDPDGATELIRVLTRVK